MEAYKAILLLNKEKDESNDTNQVTETGSNLGIHPYGARTQGTDITRGRRSPVRLLIATVGLLTVGLLLSIATLLITALLSILLTTIRSILLWWSIPTILVRLIGVLPLVRIPAHVRVHLSSLVRKEAPTHKTNVYVEASSFAPSFRSFAWSTSLASLECPGWRTSQHSHR